MTKLCPLCREKMKKEKDLYRCVNPKCGIEELELYADEMLPDPRIQKIADAIYTKWSSTDGRDLSLEFVSSMLMDKYPKLSLTDGHKIKPFIDPRLKKAVDEIETEKSKSRIGMSYALSIIYSNFPELKGDNAIEIT